MGGNWERMGGLGEVWGGHGGQLGGMGGSGGFPTSCCRYGNSLPSAPWRQKSRRNRFAFSGWGGGGRYRALPASPSLVPTAPRYRRYSPPFSPS